jgi:single-stranded DNA-specific DHH superfamily exonuclease
VNQFLEQFKDKIIYAICDSDCDGITATILFEYFIKPIAKQVIRLNTGDRKLPEFSWDIAKKSEIVLFVDIAPYSLEMANQINENSKLVIVDHHESSRRDLGENLNNYHYSTDRCASKLFFDLLTESTRAKKIIYQIVELANTYDLYMVESGLWRNAKAFNNLLYESVNWFKAKYQTDAQKYQSFVDDQIHKINNDKEFYFTAVEKQRALKAEEKEKKNYLQAKKSLKVRKDNQGTDYAYFECSSKLSWTASLLLREYPQIKYFIGHSTFLEKYRHEENGRVSLRSQKDYDVSIIAGIWKGGGHATASGLDLKLEDFNKLKNGEIHLI